MIERVETVSYGRPASESLARAVERAKAGRALAPVTVIVPSNLAGLTARRLLGSGQIGAGGIANVSFVTPFRLAELLAVDRLLDTRPLTNPVLGAAVRLALAEDPGPFAPVADHYATEAALASLYAELSNVSADALVHLERNGGAAREAVCAYRGIATQLERFHGEADVARAARERADLVDALVGLGHVIWYLPVPVTRPLAELIRAVLSEARSTAIVGLTGDEGADAAVWSVCARAGVDRTGSVDSAPATAPVASRVVSVTDADEEVRAVVRRVAALAEQGVRLDRVGIFHSTPDPYVGILHQQLAAAGLPSNGPSRRRLADTVAGRTLLAALTLPSQRWRRDKVMALASGGPVRVGGERAHPATWERISRRAGVVQDMSDWRRKLAGRRAWLQARLAELEAEPDRDEARIERTGRDLADVGELDRFVTDLHGSVAAVERARGWPAKATAASELLRQLLGPGHLHGTWPEPEQAAFERVEDVLVRLATLGELEPDPSHDVFVRALTAELDVARGRSGRFGEGVVYGPLAGAAGHDLDAVFILGCAEGLCPTARRDDALLPDAARQLVPGELDLRSARLEDQHRAFLAALAAAPAHARTLTFARGDLRGNRRALPSRWLLDSASALAGRTVHATDFPHLDAPVVEVVASFARGLDTTVHGSLADRDLAALAAHAAAGGDVGGHPVATLVARGFEAQAARRSPAFTEWDGNVAGQPIDAGIDRPFSPTRLETWAACGYRYFLRHVLGLADRDDPERVVDLSPLDRGSGVHAVLERFLAEAIERGVPDPDEPWSRAQHERIRVIAEEVFAEQESLGRTGRPLHWRLTRTDLLDMLDEFLGYDDEYRAGTQSRPERVELPFGMGGNDPVSVTLPDGREVAFRGFADRVDRARDDRLLVIDYKTGKGGGYVGIDEGDPVQEGTMLQLGLYAEAARQLLGAAATEAYYWMVDPRAGYARRGYPWTEDRRRRFVEVLGTIVEGIEAGVFLVDPGEWNIWRGTHENCTYCDFDRLCVRDRGEQAETKVEAPALRGRGGLVWSDAS